MSEDLLTEWTKGAYGLLDNIYKAERVEALDDIILNLTKVGITDLVLYNITDKDVTIRYKKRGSQTFKTVTI